MKGTKYVSALAGYFQNRRARRAAGEGSKHRPRRASPFRVESLEARLLLSADLAGAAQQTPVVQAAAVQQHTALTSTPSYVEGTINIGQVSRDSGYAYVVSQDFGTPGDTQQALTASQLRIFENGQEVGPAHTMHATIRQQGGGRFSHWGNALYFSASDNSNPTTNGRTYTYVVGNGSSSSSPSPMPASTPSPGSQAGTINVAQATRDSGYAYSIAHDFGTPGDSNQALTVSRLRIYENGRELGPAHAAHADIRQLGAGRFSHWGNALWFSASDNSNPLTNGRSYTYRVYSTTTSPTPNPNPSPSPSPTPGTIKTDMGVYKEPVLPSLPAAGSKVIDPTFGTTILRLTDGADGNVGSQVGYSYWPTFNADSTRAYVNSQYGGSWYGKFYEFDPDSFTAGSSSVLTTAPPSGGLPWVHDMVWSGVNPNVIYGHDRLNKLWAYNVPNGTYTLVKDFSSNVVPGGGIYEMSRSLNDDVFSFMLTDTPNYGNRVGYMVWQKSTNQILLKQLSNTADEAHLDKTGRYLIVEHVGSNFGNQQIWDLQSQSVTNLNWGVDGFIHFDTGQGTVLTGGFANDLRYRQLSTPKSWTTIVPGYIAYDTQQDHFSMLADNERWTVLSRYSTNGGSVINAFDNEIVQIATDGSNQVRRLAHHRSIYNDFYDTPRANISRDGQFIAFTSNWGNANGRHDVYVVKISPA